MKIGSSDDPSEFRPQANIWTKSAQPWHCLDGALMSFDHDPELGVTALVELTRASTVKLARKIGKVFRRRNRRSLRMTG